MTSRATSPINVSRSALTVGRLCGCPMKRLFTKPPSRRKSLGASTTSSGTACCFERPRGGALGKTVQLVVTVEEWVHGGAGDGVVGLPENPPRQRQRHQIPPSLVVPHQRPVVEDHRRRDTELVAQPIRARRHPAGGDREADPALPGAPQPGHQG